MPETTQNPDPLRDRAAAMLARVEDEAARVLDAAGADLVRRAVAVALGIRDRAIDDDHDPRYLHPARTVRILIADAGLRAPHALAAAAFIDSVDVGLAVPPDALGGDFENTVRDVPLPSGDEDLLERLVAAPPDLATVALAEALDQVRHVHLRTDLPWRPAYEEVRAVYIPAARRIAPPLARRFERWADAFERRLLLRE